MDHEPKVTADPTTSDTTSNRSYETAVDCRVTGSLVESINNLTMESGTTPLSQVGAPERCGNIDAWERDVTPDRAPSSVSPPRWYLQSESGSVSQPPSPTRLRKPSRHIDFAKDPTLDKKTRVIVVEKKCRKPRAGASKRVPCTLRVAGNDRRLGCAVRINYRDSNGRYCDWESAQSGAQVQRRIVRLQSTRS
jgi:hypothetical protein